MKAAKEVKSQEPISNIKTSAASRVKTYGNYVIDEYDIVLGNQNSNVVFIEYFSPTCPHCVYYHKKTFPLIKKKYIDTNKITYVNREFIGNKQDLDATILARCAGNEKSYHKFIDVLLSQQRNWAYSKNYREILTNIGTLGGINRPKIRSCLNNQDMRPK